MEEIISEVTAAATFDANRAILSRKDLFRPLPVQRTERLANTLAGEKVKADAPLLLLEQDDAVLTLLTHQMIYHHVAQGELGGTPFLATF